MKPACDADDSDERWRIVNSEDDDNYKKEFEKTRLRKLILISRLAISLYENKDGHPITHVTGISVDEILSYAKAYAPGVNVGLHMPHKDFPYK